MVKATVPEAICTWTSTGRASTPSKATVDTRATMSAPARAHRWSERLQNIGPSARGKSVGNRGRASKRERSGGLEPTRAAPHKRQ